MKLLLGDCIDILKTLEPNSVDSIVTDPPYGLEFMGKDWDSPWKGQASPEFNTSCEGKLGGFKSLPNHSRVNNVQCKICNKWKFSGSPCVCDNPDFPNARLMAMQQFQDWNLLWAKECLRVLKPGGHLLAFSGTRTYHRMAVAIEDAGFEVRDMIEWVYGSGFPKSLNIGKAVNSLETDEWLKISKAFDNVDQKSIMEVWKSNAKLAGIKLSKSLTGVGGSMQKKYFVHDIAVLYPNQENKNASAIIAELNSCVPNHTSEETLTIAVESVEQNTELSQDLAKSVVKLSQSHGVSSWNIFTAQCDVKEWLNENTEVNLKVDEALKTLRGNKKYSNEEITNVLCVALTDILKLTILNQSNTFQNLDTKSQTECLSAISAIITEYTAENLISNTVAILKSKAVDKLQGNERVFSHKNPANRPYNLTKGETSTGWQSPPRPDKTKGTSEWEGWGTALKPAHEPICMARKPLAEKTVAENILKYGTGGINIDGSRVGTEESLERPYGGGNEVYGEYKMPRGTITGEGLTGRFPANLIHDNSEEVRECFPESKSTQNKLSDERKNEGNSMFIDGVHNPENSYADSGNASRFFKSIIYKSKASKRDRGEGNIHPTVKSVALMEYLIKMVTPKGGVVLDPFAGSGSTLVAAKQNGFDYIGIELTLEYIPIIEARLNAVEPSLF